MACENLGSSWASWEWGGICDSLRLEDSSAGENVELGETVGFIVRQVPVP